MDRRIATRRAVFLDELRGLCVLLMIFYHGAYDVAYVFGANFPAFRAWPFKILQLFICCNFIFIAGISSRYSRNNIKRGFIVLGAAALMTLGTYFFMRDQLIVFGVLHLLGICMVLHGLFYWNAKESGIFSAAFGFAACLCLFAFTWGAGSRHVGFFDILKIPLPEFLYDNYYLSVIGFLSPDFYSSDYFPLLPWAFLFFAGSFLGICFKRNEMPEFFYKSHAPFLGKAGKRALLIYMIHQPVTYGVLRLAFMGMQAAGLRLP